jgi:regulatory protein
MTRKVRSNLPSNLEGLSEAEQAERAADPLAARKKAMDYLARREYGREELSARLVSAGFQESTALSAVERLTSEGLQDDRRFVDNFIQSRVQQGKGPVRIRLELGQRGVGETLIDEVLDERDDKWRSLARTIRQRKFGPDQPRDFREKARQMRFLQFRGFTHDQIHAAFGPDAD